MLFRSGLMNANFTERKAMTWLRQYMASERSKVPNKFIKTNVENTQLYPDVEVFPIPARDYIYVNARKANAAEILSLTGKVLLQANNLSEKINIEHLPKGIYLVRVKIENKVVVRKFVKE